jgi:uncharacterized membrane protein YqhA
MPRPTLPVPIDDQHGSPLARLIGRSRIIVIVAVAAVMASAISLFLLGAALAGETIWSAWRQVLGGEIGTTLLTVRFLEIVTVMLKAVFFYIIGVGLYSLFISPLNVTVALGVETLNDLETKIISVIVVILSVNFLELFIDKHSRTDVLWSAAALALAVVALTVFQWQTHRAGQEHKHQDPDVLERAKLELFERRHEEQIGGDAPARDADAGTAADPTDSSRTGAGAGDAKRRQS